MRRRPALARSRSNPPERAPEPPSGARWARLRRQATSRRAPAVHAAAGPAPARDPVHVVPEGGLLDHLQPAAPPRPRRARPPSPGRPARDPVSSSSHLRPPSRAEDRRTSRRLLRCSPERGERRPARGDWNPALHPRSPSRRWARGRGSSLGAVSRATFRIASWWSVGRVAPGRGEAGGAPTPRARGGWAVTHHRGRSRHPSFRACRRIGRSPARRARCPR